MQRKDKTKHPNNMNIARILIYYVTNKKLPVCRHTHGLCKYFIHLGIATSLTRGWVEWATWNIDSIMTTWVTLRVPSPSDFVIMVSLAPGIKRSHWFEKNMRVKNWEHLGCVKNGGTLPAHGYWNCNLCSFLRLQTFAGGRSTHLPASFIGIKFGTNWDFVPSIHERSEPFSTGQLVTAILAWILLHGCTGSFLRFPGDTGLCTMHACVTTTWFCFLQLAGKKCKHAHHKLSNTQCTEIKGTIFCAHPDLPCTAKISKTKCTCVKKSDAQEFEFWYRCTHTHACWCKKFPFHLQFWIHYQFCNLVCACTHDVFTRGTFWAIKVLWKVLLQPLRIPKSIHSAGVNDCLLCKASRNSTHSQSPIRHMHTRTVWIYVPRDCFCVPRKCAKVRVLQWAATVLIREGEHSNQVSLQGLQHPWCRFRGQLCFSSKISTKRSTICHAVFSEPSWAEELRLLSHFSSKRDKSLCMELQMLQLHVLQENHLKNDFCTWNEIHWTQNLANRRRRRTLKGGERRRAQVVQQETVEWMETWGYFDLLCSLWASDPFVCAVSGANIFSSSPWNN